MRNCSCLWIEERYYRNVHIIQSNTYSECNLSQNLNELFFTKVEKNAKICIKSQETLNKQSNFKKNKTKLKFSDFGIYYKTRVN